MPTREQLLEELIAKNPNDPFPRYGLALEYKNGGRHGDAARLFDELVAAHPDYVAAYLHAGNNAIAQGRREIARTLFDRGIEACRRKGDAHALAELEAALDGL